MPVPVPLCCAMARITAVVNPTAATAAIRETVIVFSPGWRRVAPCENESGSAAGGEDPLFQIGVISRRCDDLVVLVDAESLIADRCHRRSFHLIGDVLPLFFGAGGGHVFFQGVAQFENVRDCLADVGN